jgi:hypothetical protein
MVKVEAFLDEKEGITKFVFECNRDEDHQTLDMLRVAILGDHPKRGGYETGNRLIIEAKVPETKLS